MSKEKILEGKLILWSETGMEGGRLAILDNKYYELVIPKFGLGENEKVWDRDDRDRIGITSNPESFFDGTWIPRRDPLLDDKDYKISSLFRGEDQGDFNADKRLMEKFGFRMKYRKDRADINYGVGNWEFVKNSSNIILKNGNIVSLGSTPTSKPERPYAYQLSEFSRVTVHWKDGTVETKRLSNTLLIESWGDYQSLNILKETDFLKIKSPSLDKIIAEGQINLISLKTFSSTAKGHFDNIVDGNNWEDFFRKGYSAELFRDKI